MRPTANPLMGGTTTTRKTASRTWRLLVAGWFAAATLTSDAVGQPAGQPGRGFGPQGPQVVSPEVSPERKITFRILAPKAEAVRLGGNDLPGLGQGAEMVKATNGIWEVTLWPVAPGAYRYHFNVDGVTVMDPQNPVASESSANSWSLVAVPGSDFMDTKEVPHGAVATVTYYSKSLHRFRQQLTF